MNKSWREVLQLPSDTSKDEVESKFRLLAKSAHPDAGGSTDAMTELNIAKRDALEELSKPIPYKNSYAYANAAYAQMNQAMSQNQQWGSMYGQSLGAMGGASQAQYQGATHDESQFTNQQVPPVNNRSAWRRFWEGEK